MTKFVALSILVLVPTLTGYGDATTQAQKIEYLPSNDNVFVTAKFPVSEETRKRDQIDIARGFFHSYEGFWKAKDAKDDPVWPILTEIDCAKSDMSCTEQSASLVGPTGPGLRKIELDDTYYDVTEWDDAQIIASDEADACKTHTLIINLNTRNITVVDSLTGSKAELCKGLETNTFNFVYGEVWLNLQKMPAIFTSPSR